MLPCAEIPYRITTRYSVFNGVTAFNGAYGGGGGSEIVGSNRVSNGRGDVGGGSDNTRYDHSDGGGVRGATSKRCSGSEVGDGAVPRSGINTMMLPGQPLTFCGMTTFWDSG